MSTRVPVHAPLAGGAPALAHAELAPVGPIRGRAARLPTRSATFRYNESRPPGGLSTHVDQHPGESPAAPIPEPSGGQPVLWTVEHGRVIFTAAFHLARGSCCGSGCRHCPFEPRHVAGTVTPRADAALPQPTPGASTRNPPRR